jgi:hypothetical protein
MNLPPFIFQPPCVELSSDGDQEFVENSGKSPAPKVLSTSGLNWRPGAFASRHSLVFEFVPLGGACWRPGVSLPALYMYGIMGLTTSSLSFPPRPADKLPENGCGMRYGGLPEVVMEGVER